MKKTIFILLMSFCLLAIGQEPTFHVKKTVQTYESLTKNLKQTSYNYKNLPVWVSGDSTFYVVKKSEKTGGYYKVKLFKD